MDIFPVNHYLNVKKLAINLFLTLILTVALGAPNPKLIPLASFFHV